jgi:hypothetical protein
MPKWYGLQGLIIIIWHYQRHNDSPHVHMLGTLFIAQQRLNCFLNQLHG